MTFPTMVPEVRNSCWARLLFTSPVSSCTVEKSFSALRRLKIGSGLSLAKNVSCCRCSRHTWASPISSRAYTSTPPGPVVLRSSPNTGFWNNHQINMKLFYCIIMFEIVFGNSRFLQRPQKRNRGNQLINRRLSKPKLIGSGSDPESQASGWSDGYSGWCLELRREGK